MEPIPESERVVETVVDPVGNVVVLLIIKRNALVKLKEAKTQDHLPSLSLSPSFSAHPKQRHSMERLFSEADQIHSNPTIDDPLLGHPRQIMVYLFSHMTIT